MAREEVTSTLLGYTSIACWLCAQFPQMIYTWRRKSVEGLALSLLANWLLGDTTNLIGCILTHQLPFQTHLAAYFVFIDICLVTQFLYYDGRPRHHETSVSVVKSSESSVPYQSQTSPLLEAHAFTHGQPFRSRSVSHSLDPGTTVTNVTRAPSELDYEREGITHWRSRGSRRASSLMGLPEDFVADPGGRHWVTRRYISLERGRDDAKDEASDVEFESSPAVLGESVHSEGRGRGRGRGESSGRDNSNISQRESPEELFGDVEPWSGTAPSTVRGRPLTCTNVHISPVVIGDTTLSETATHLSRARGTSAMSAVSDAVSRRSTSLVFLAVFALFGFSSSSLGIRGSAGSEGRVLNIVPRSIPDGAPISSSSTYTTPLSTTTVPHSPVVRLGSDVVGLVILSKDVQLIIGRVSAWTCTTLYMTSRLPQIWKNFVRKSVEGASMYLFIFAFLGNLFYVLSIVTNPKMDLPEPQASKFIRDSVPYILGSGGTLLLDVTILAQSLVYDPRRRLLRSRKGIWKRSLLVGGTREEERRMLLEADHPVADAC